MADTGGINFLVAFTLGTLALLVMAVAIISFVLFYQRRVIAHQLEINKKDEEMLRATILSQEEERRRVARDLHDELGPMLSAIKLKSGQIKAKIEENGLDATDIGESKEMIDIAIAQVRNISHLLFPPAFEMHGLATALENVCRKINSDGLQIQYSYPEHYKRINGEKELAVYRVVMELLNNIIKHSQATKATIKLEQDVDGNIEIVVSDNGSGFDAKNLAGREGLGLKNIQSRISTIKANIDFQSSASGTSVKINVSTI